MKKTAVHAHKHYEADTYAQEYTTDMHTYSIFLSYTSSALKQECYIF